jgi:hypothetical protein
METDLFSKKLSEEIYTILKERYSLTYKKREKFYLNNEKLSTADILNRYGNDTVTISQLNSMTNEEKKIYEFLNRGKQSRTLSRKLMLHIYLFKVINEDTKLKLPVIETNYLRNHHYDSLTSRIKINQNIKVYKQYKPFLDDLYKIKYRQTTEISTQTFEFQSYLKPLWKTQQSKPFNKESNSNKKKSLKPIDINKSNVVYSAYDLRQCRYLRVKNKEDETVF